MPNPTWTQTPQVSGRYWLQWADAPRREPPLVHVYQSAGLWRYETVYGRWWYLHDAPKTAWFWGPVVAPAFEVPVTPDHLVTPRPDTTWVLGKVTLLGPEMPRMETYEPAQGEEEHG